MVEYNTITIHYSQKFYLIIIGQPYSHRIGYTGLLTTLLLQAPYIHDRINLTSWGLKSDLLFPMVNCELETFTPHDLKKKERLASSWSSLIRDCAFIQASGNGGNVESVKCFYVSKRPWRRADNRRGWATAYTRKSLRVKQLKSYSPDSSGRTVRDLDS